MSSRTSLAAEKAKLRQPKVLYWTAYSLQATLRFVRVHITPRTTNWMNSHENKKVAVCKSRRYVGLSVLLHILPFTSAITFIFMNMCGTFIGEVTIATVTAMQFAAKALEVLIQASLARIILDLVRTWALGPDSIPLGSLVMPYRITQISHLLSLELWGSLTAGCYARRYRRFLLAFLALAVITSASLVGPSSAVLLIPRPITYAADRILMFSSEKDLLFPKTIPFNGQIT